MENLVASIITGVTVSIIVGLLVWFKTKGFSFYDRYTVHSWLKSNTKDVPHESHVDTMTIAKGTGLPEIRAQRACMSSKKIYRYSRDKELWSVWRLEPQSIYDVLSKEEMLDGMRY
ncbi:MAG: hypothetical protein PHU03_07740 [Syntrophales bacterium]|nr:hypothetical protein [Syntrophales bacterium]